MVSVNSRTMVDGLSPFCTCVRVSPFIVHTDFTLRPSMVSSSNSSSNLKEITVVLKVDDVHRVYTLSSPFFNSTVGLRLLPIFRSTKPTPKSYKKHTKHQLMLIYCISFEINGIISFVEIFPTKYIFIKYFIKLKFSIFNPIR